MPRVESKLRVFLFKIQFKAQVCVHLDIFCTKVISVSSKFSFVSGDRLQEKLNHCELCMRRGNLLGSAYLFFVLSFYLIFNKTQCACSRSEVL